MLKGIDPVLGPEMLGILRAMGHADEICIADANFPSASNARRLVRADGVTATKLVRAIAEVMPIDNFVEAAAFSMEATGKPGEFPPIISEFSAILQDSGYNGPIQALERFAFYDRAAKCYAIVASGEDRLWGNLILKKGWLPPGAYHSETHATPSSAGKHPLATAKRFLPYAD
jgi:L-fucose mutarotase